MPALYQSKFGILSSGQYSEGALDLLSNIVKLMNVGIVTYVHIFYK